MKIALLRSASKVVAPKNQEEIILTYTLANNIDIERYATDNAPVKKRLEERPRLLDFLQSMSGKEELVVYDFWVLSRRVDELVKILSCLFTKDVTLHLAARSMILRGSDSAVSILTHLAELRSETQQQKPAIGRPKGSISESRFDMLKPDILRSIAEGQSVTLIAKRLGVPRSSLNDYIVSRNLKEFINKLSAPLSPSMPAILDENTEKCPLEEIFEQHNLRKEQ